MFRVSHRGDDSSLLSFSMLDPLGWIDADQFGRGIAAGTLRRDWTWLAFIDDTVGAAPVARAVWWGPVGSVYPIELRCLIVDPGVPHPELWGAAIIRSAHRAFAADGAVFTPDVVIEVADGWQNDSVAAAAVAWRVQAAREAGAQVVVRQPAPDAPTTTLEPVASRGR